MCLKLIIFLLFSDHKTQATMQTEFRLFRSRRALSLPAKLLQLQDAQPESWIHIMFLAVQARSQRAVCQQDPSVGNLKACWDTLKLDSGNSFVRLVTSSFRLQGYVSFISCVTYVK